MKRLSAQAGAPRIFVVVLSLARVTTAVADEDIHFLAEHAVESGMDAAYMSLPWPAAALTPGRWQASVDLARAGTSTDFIRMRGSVVAAAAARGVGAHWGYELVALNGDFGMSGGAGRPLLTQGFLGGTPLDLPQLADISNPRGTQRQAAVGAAGVYDLRGADSAHSSQLIAGLLLERVNITRFAMDYRLVGGADAGASGTLEYDSRASFVTPFVAWQQTRALSAHWTWSPRAMFVAPLPSRDLDTRLTGPQFDVSTPRGSPAVPIGDSFVVLGLAFRHRPSGLEVDIGGLLYYAVGETASHPGVDGARVVHVAWRPGSR